MTEKWDIAVQCFFLAEIGIIALILLIAFIYYQLTKKTNPKAEWFGWVAIGLPALGLIFIFVIYPFFFGFHGIALNEPGFLENRGIIERR